MAAIKLHDETKKNIFHYYIALNREVEISYVYGYVQRYRETCLCQLKNTNAHGEAAVLGTHAHPHQIMR